MNTCSYCGRSAEEETKEVEGIKILKKCVDCEDEILNPVEHLKHY